MLSWANSGQCTRNAEEAGASAADVSLGTAAARQQLQAQRPRPASRPRRRALRAVLSGRPGPLCRAGRALGFQGPSLHKLLRRQRLPVPRRGPAALAPPVVPGPSCPISCCQGLRAPLREVVRGMNARKHVTLGGREGRRAVVWPSARQRPGRETPGARSQPRGGTGGNRDAVSSGAPRQEQGSHVIPF